VDLVTGALPAEFGLRTSGIIDIKTKSGALEPGGSVSIYAGSHGTLQPSFDYAGSSGDIQYFVSGDFLTSGLGIESPDGSSNPLHDQTHQHHGFGYIEKLIDANNRVGAGLGSSVGSFEIPNRGNQQTTYALTGTTPTPYPSDTLNENQREVTQFAFLSYQHSDGQLDWQTSLVSRYSSLTFNPDVTGDLLFDGIAQHAYKLNKALALQSDASYRVNDDHTLRAGVFIQHDRSISRTNSQVFVLDSPGGNQVVNPSTGDNQTESIVDNGNQAEWIESLYAQDEWAFAPTWTLNYGLRFDHYNAYSSGQQLSPRVNVVWKATPQTTVHAGYSRYFSPPPFELVGSASVAKYLSPPTSATPEVTQNDTPQAERANYLDLGVDQKLSSAWSVGVDSYFKRSHNLIDEGQFGAPIILTPFNYAKGTQYGAEFKINYAGPRLSAYGNLALQSAKGRNINSSQFNFGADDLAYIANHYIDLDHEQHLTASAGISYLWQGVRFNADALLGSGLRADRMLADGTTIPNGAHLPFYAQINVGVSRKIYTSDTQWYSLRLDVINLLDRKYEIRDGSGVGVGAPQYGPRRGVFIGVSKSL
jgi:outer membrane receptor protein involved in Fe transport